MDAGTAPTGVRGRRPLRPLGVAETLDAAVGLYSKNHVKLWSLVAVVLVPVYALVAIILKLTVPDGSFVEGGVLHVGNTAAFDVGVAFSVALGVFGYVLATGAVFKLQLDSYLGRPTDIRASFDYAFGRHRLLSLLWLGIIATVLIAVGLVLLVIPGIYAFVAVAFAIPVLMLEGLRGMTAIGRSMTLVADRWWATFARLLVGVLLAGVATYAVDRIGSAITDGVSSISLFLIINGIVGIVAAVFIAPFYAALVTVTYVDLRVRKEGIDEETLLSGATPTGPPPGVERLPGSAPDPQAPTPHAGPSDFEPPSSGS
jgi:hypothetical protein